MKANSRDTAEAQLLAFSLRASYGVLPSIEVVGEFSLEIAVIIISRELVELDQPPPSGPVAMLVHRAMNRCPTLDLTLFLVRPSCDFSDSVYLGSEHFWPQAA